MSLQDFCFTQAAPDNGPLLAEIKELKLKVEEQDQEISALKQKLAKYEQAEADEPDNVADEPEQAEDQVTFLLLSLSVIVKSCSIDLKLGGLLS